MVSALGGLVRDVNVDFVGKPLRPPSHFLSLPRSLGQTGSAGDASLLLVTPEAS